MLFRKLLPPKLVVAAALGGSVVKMSTVPASSASGAPTWSELSTRVLATAAGQRLKEEDELRAQGRGPPHRASKVRLFGAASEDDIRVTLYRDTAAWCPYCQKLWIMLEEKQVPYKVELINMRSYGDKPQSFLKKVPRGILPALELDGKMYTESLDIMAMIDDAFSGPEHRPLLPPRSHPSFQQMQNLMRLERQLFGTWCGYVFRAGVNGKRDFEATMKEVDAALGKLPNTPWFLDFTDGPSILDLQYVSHIERMAASVPYWKGHAIRGNGVYPNVDRWFEAFEQRDSYNASRSDWYTHIKDIPPQYGPGVPVREAAQISASIDGGDASWRLPLPALTQSPAISDGLQPGWEQFEEEAHLEAAYRVVANCKAVSGFMARGAGTPGGWSEGRPDRAELADPYAKAATGNVADASDEALRAAVALLLDGAVPKDEHKALVAQVLQKGGSKQEVVACSEYLRDRVGVPRDMSYPAARCLRGALNWVASSL